MVGGGPVGGAVVGSAGNGNLVGAGPVEGLQGMRAAGQHALATEQVMDYQMSARGQPGPRVAPPAAGCIDVCSAGGGVALKGSGVRGGNGGIVGDDDSEEVDDRNDTQGQRQQRSLLSRCLTLASSASSIGQSGPQEEILDDGVLVEGQQEEVQLTGVDVAAEKARRGSLGSGVSSVSVKQQRSVMFGADPWEQPSVGFAEYLKQLVQEYGGEDGDE